MAFRPYLAFAGNAREAYTRYQEIFGGELVLLDFASVPDAGPPPEGAKPDAIMHAALMAGDALLMGADDPSGNFNPNKVLPVPEAAHGAGRRVGMPGLVPEGMWV